MAKPQTVRQRVTQRRKERDAARGATPSLQPQTTPGPGSPCPVCGAMGDNACLTKAGNEAKKNHKERS